MSSLQQGPSLRLVELLSSRLCHDLISPVGAVKSGLELLSEFSDDPGGEAMALITSSADSASRKLQFFRMAFGMAGSAQAISHSEAVDLCEVMVVTKRTRLDWPDSVVPATADMMKIALNLVVLAGEALARGGEIQVRPDSADTRRIEILAASAEAQLSEEIRAAALGSAAEADLTPRTVQAYLTHLFVGRQGARLTIEERAGDGIRFAMQ